MNGNGTPRSVVSEGASVQRRRACHRPGRPATPAEFSLRDSQTESRKRVCKLILDHPINSRHLHDLKSNDIQLLSSGTKC